MPESQSIVQAKSTIDDLLQFVAGRAVPVVDAFRLGKPKRDQGWVITDEDSKSRPQPILESNLVVYGVGEWFCLQSTNYKSLNRVHSVFMLICQSLNEKG